MGGTAVLRVTKECQILMFGGGGEAAGREVVEGVTAAQDYRDGH